MVSDWVHTQKILKLWEADSQEKYTIKSCRNIIDRIGFSFTSLWWKVIAPPTIEIFLSLLLHLYKGFSNKRDLINLSEAICPFCADEIEYVNHLFLHCYIWTLEALAAFHEMIWIKLEHAKIYRSSCFAVDFTCWRQVQRKSIRDVILRYFVGKLKCRNKLIVEDRMPN
jgi:hypothetical protein